ncbi:hypothetical protein BH10PSE6_BH10PSE6_06650 [soil metagenome]
MSSLAIASIIFGCALSSALDPFGRILRITDAPLRHVLLQIGR